MKLAVNHSHLRADFIAVDTGTLGNAGVVRDSVTLVARRRAAGGATL